MQQRAVPFLLLVSIFLFSCTSKKLVADQQQDPFKSLPLNSETDLTPFISHFSDAEIIVIGEASHGTHEFYQWRAAITKKLIAEKGFSVIAVEGDWKDCFGINRFLNDPATDNDPQNILLKNFKRFPQWLWKNEETAGFLQWAKTFNQHEPNKKISFYGLDLFSINESLLALKNHKDSSVKLQVNKCIACLGSFAKEESDYSLRSETTSCGKAFEKLDSIYKSAPSSGDLYYDLLVRAAVDGEKYYRLARNERVTSWNLRENHMLGVFRRLLQNHGNHTKIVVWVHNTHAGNAHYSEMSRSGQTSLGELLKTNFKKVFLIGFDSYVGTVIAAKSWGGKTDTVPLLPARKGSVGQLLHESYTGNRIILTENLKMHPVFRSWVDLRAAGAVYRPERETYVPSVLPGRFDVLIFIDSSHALHPLRQQDRLTKL